MSTPSASPRDRSARSLGSAAVLGLAAALAVVLGLLVAAPAGAVASTAPPAGQDGTVRAAPTDPPRSLRAPRVTGTPRFGRTLRATAGRWSPRPDKVRYQWVRGRQPIRGGTGPRYTPRPDDVGWRVWVQVHVKVEGRPWAQAASAPVRVKHRTGVRRTVRYSVRTKGRVGPLGEFPRLAQQTLSDARGWRAMGVRFVRVRNGGAFTLWLSQASLVPTFSSGCSAQWSCRVGRNVIINVERWRHASPAWNAAGRSLRDYRHMVVNHEVGHFLGRGHASCPRRGAPAPVMMQQSKGRDGCRFNPWPTRGELGIG